MALISIPHPKTIDELVFNDDATEKRVRQYASCRRAGHLIFHGPKGTGKSSAARCIVQSVFDLFDNPNPIPEYHAKNLGQTSMVLFENEWNWQRISGVKHPYIIINEIDQTSPQKLHEIRAMMEGREIGKFIFTTNKIHSLDEPFVDRCDDIEMPPIDIGRWRPIVFDWLHTNQIQANTEIVEKMLETNTGTIRDLRRIVEDIACEIE